MIHQLNQKFGIADALQFSVHSSGLIQGVIKTSTCSGSFFLLGGHLAEYQPSGQSKPVLFMSREAVFEVGKPIRGGVPICFPWFGPKASDPSAPAHGLVRTELWQVTGSKRLNDAIVVDLSLNTAGFGLVYQISFGSKLGMSLTVSNLSEHVKPCEVALHTYFTIGDVSKVSIRGLESISYFDKISQKSEPASGNPIVFTAETDRVYSGVTPQIALEDSSLARTIVLRPQNSKSTVVWNPWIEKSKRLADFGDDEYLQMCCIETANVGQNQLELQPAKSESVAVEISLA